MATPQEVQKAAETWHKHQVNIRARNRAYFYTSLQDCLRHPNFLRTGEFSKNHYMSCDKPKVIESTSLIIKLTSPPGEIGKITVTAKGPQ